MRAGVLGAAATEGEGVALCSWPHRSSGAWGCKAQSGRMGMFLCGEAVIGKHRFASQVFVFSLFFLSIEYCT